jgi:molybdopterin molybdotransferase
MISVEEAKSILEKNLRVADSVLCPLSEAAGLVLAKNIRATFDMPRFDQSAVDGYALMIDVKNPAIPERFHIVQEIKAGDQPVTNSKKNVAYRIFTGAPVPKGTFCVVMQEQVVVENGYVIPDITAVLPKRHIRFQGGNFRKGEVVLHKGSTLSPAAIGLLTSLGLTSVTVYRQPRVGLLVTGNELVIPGHPLKPGQLYESNSATLRAALQCDGFTLEKVLRAKDTLKAVEQNLGKLISTCDIILVTGGISVGKYDFVAEALKKHRVKKLFYKVAQKPGKPIFVGRKSKKLIFALPGNPAAVLVCYREYVLPSLLQMTGKNSLIIKQLSIDHPFSYTGDRAQFFRAVEVGNSVKILGAQDSDNLLSFAEANALVYLSKGNHHLSQGDLVEVHPL